MSENTNKPSVLCFEKYYPCENDSIEYSIRYDRKPYLHDKKIIGYITLEHVGDITIPVNQLDWVINILQRIRDEIS